MTDTCDVAVVGAGPIGLAVACGLARAGRSVVVLEKQASTAEHSRAPAIWSRSQEILAGLGVIDAFVAGGITLDRLELHDADSADDVILLSIPVCELADATPYPQLLILPQSETERLLCAAVRAQPGATVHFGAEATDVEQDDVGVRVMYRQAGETRVVRAAYVAGCDGGRSTVRDRLGVTFDGETYGTRAALADITPHVSQDVPFPRITTEDDLAVAIRMDERKWRLILPIGGGDERALDDRVERAAARLFSGVRTRTDYETVWQSEFRLHRKIASRFVVGRIALAGDAAHLNSPVGGQGMNAGFVDVEVLTAALVRALDSDDPSVLLEYERARIGAVREGVNAFTDRMTRLLLFGRGRAVRAVLAMARVALRVPRLRRAFLERIAMLQTS